MNRFKDYKFPLLTSITTLMFVALLASHMINLKSTTVSKEEILYKRSTRRYSNVLTLIDVKNKISYRRDFKKYGISNLFMDIKKLKAAKKVYITYSGQGAGRTGAKRFFCAADHPIGHLELFINIISFVICNQTLILAIPLILSTLSAPREDLSRGEGSGLLEERLINFSHYLTAFFFLLFAIF